MKKFSLLLLAGFLFTLTSALADEAQFKIYGYADTYYATDNDHLRQTEGFQNMRKYSPVNSYKDEFGLNVAQLCAHGNYGRARGKVAFYWGNLADYFSSYTSISGLQQAHLGFNPFQNFWIDAGYFLSHIGDEHLLPGHNWLSSYSFVRQYQPFFQSGIRFGWETEKLVAQLWIVNAKGQFKENNFNKTLGIFVKYKPMENFMVSYGNLIGNEQPGNPSNSLLEMIHNVCAEYEISPAFAVKGEFDFMTWENPNEDEDGSSSIGIAAQAHYKFSPIYSITGRIAMVSHTHPESDPDFSGTHITVGGEYKPTPNTYVRLEGSMLNFGDDFQYFRDADGEPTGSRMEAALNFGIFIK